MHKLFQRQLAKATREPGKVDLDALASLVVAAYEDAERDRRRTDRSLGLMAEELERANARLLEAFEVVPEGLVLLDADGRFVLWNRRFAELYDSAPHTIAVGASFADSVRACVERGHFPDAIGREEAWIADRLTRNSCDRNSSEQRLSGDRWVRVEERRTADGGSIGVRIDITDLKRREESFRLLFEDNPIPMWVVDLESHQFVAVNAATVAHYGYSREQFLAMTAYDIRPPEDHEKFQSYIKDRKVSQGEVVWRHLKSNGDSVLVTVYSRSIVHNGRPARLNAIIDVTERRRAEEKLLAQKLQTETAVDNMSQGLVMFDADERLVLCNNRYIEMYALNPELVKPGCTLREIIEFRRQVGMLSGDPEQYYSAILGRVGEGRMSTDCLTLSDGRSIQTVSRPMPGGGWVATHEDVTERIQAQARIEYLAHHDSLTGLPNRSAFNNCMSRTLANAEKYGGNFAVVCIDFDRFKEVNDVYGHAAGDGLLRELGKRMKEAVADAFLARIGGDEFSLIVTGGVQPAVTESLTERLLAAAAPEIEVDGRVLRTGLSAGVAIYPADGTDAETLLANADAALYRAKNEGRGLVRFFEAGMDQRLRERRALQQDLRSAIDRDEVQLYYQPQALIDGRIVGVEALARWHHPVRGFISPGVFIPVAEDSGLIVALGERILRNACNEAASWPLPLRVAVNLSPVQFQHGDLPAIVHSALLESGLAPHRLELEITEGVLIGDFSRALSILRRLKMLGVRIAMDDFGTGYSSLSYLQAFPFDRIKIDQGFIAKLFQNPQSAAIIRAVIGLARGLSMPVTAEGVETEAQLVFLAGEGCDEVQGYLIGKPQPIEHYAEVVGRDMRARCMPKASVG